MKIFKIKQVWVITYCMSLISFFVSAQRVDGNYIKYYKIINQVEQALIVARRSPSGSDFFKQQAFSLYQKAFLKVNQPKKGDLITAFFLAHEQKKLSEAKVFLRKAFLAGLTINDFRNHRKLTSSMLETSIVKEVLADYPEARQEFLKKRKAEVRYCKQFFEFGVFQYQKELTMGKPPKLSPAIELKHNLEISQLKELIKTKGFPLFDDSKDIWLLLLVLTKSYIESDMFDVLLENVKRGRLSPSDYAVCYDGWSVANKKINFYGELKTHVEVKKHPKMKENRKKIGLRPLQN